MFRSILSLAVTSFFISSVTFADSPLTSTGIHLAYTDVKAVRSAVMADGKATAEIIDFLVDEKNPADQKVAVVTALGWTYGGQKNAPLFKEALKAARGITNIDFADDGISAVDSMIYGFLEAHDDYFNPSVGGTYIQAAVNKAPKNKLIGFVNALVEAQLLLGGDWCQVYTIMAKQKPGKDTGLRKEAIENVMEYISLYKNDSCPQ